MSGTESYESSEEKLRFDIRTERNDSSEGKLRFDLRRHPPKEPLKSSPLRDVITTTLETLSGKAKESEEARQERERLQAEYHFNHGNL